MTVSIFIFSKFSLRKPEQRIAHRLSALEALRYCPLHIDIYLLTYCLPSIQEITVISIFFKSNKNSQFRISEMNTARPRMPSPFTAGIFYNSWPIPLQSMPIHIFNTNLPNLKNHHYRHLSDKLTPCRCQRWKDSRCGRAQHTWHPIKCSSLIVDIKYIFIRPCSSTIVISPPRSSKFTCLKEAERCSEKNRWRSAAPVHSALLWPLADVKRGDSYTQSGTLFPLRMWYVGEIGNI